MNCNKNILNFSNQEAKEFFLKNESYCNIDLPSYFNFESILKEVSYKLQSTKLSDFYNEKVKPYDLEDVNHKFLNNKNGHYSWRPFQIIHPALYVSLVNALTYENNWLLIKNRFDDFRSNKNISCISIPIESITKEKDKAESVKCWWNEVEQKSLELSLEYQYLVQTDIINCYDSIYTHSISWALHGKEFSKTKEAKNDKNLLGNLVDSCIRNMSFGQTNGIPQGSVIMDFIAEIVLGHVDELLSCKLEESSVHKYHIIRYRDDYRIFSNNLSEAEQILKILSEILSAFGMRLNSHKTDTSSELISASIKEDKLYYICNKNKSTNLQKDLLIIYSFANKYTNSGSLNRALTKFFERIKNKATLGYENIPVLISIVTDIAFKNPRTYPVYSAIISKLISLLEDPFQKIELIGKIMKKFELLPNTGYLEIWLQRITLSLDKTFNYEEKLCGLICGNMESIWNSDWLKPEFAEIFKKIKIYDKEIIKTMPAVMEEIEFSLFVLKDY